MENDSQGLARYAMTKSNEPNEQQRLDLQHQIWLLTLNGKLYTAPLSPRISSILDIGCGTAMWAHAIAKECPMAYVTAMDLTPPNVAPLPNMTILKADAEQQWQFDQKFDFIHGRMITSGIHDWPALLSRCWGHLLPGGWLELLDICHPFGAEDLTTNESSSSFIKWGQIAEACWAMNGLDYRATTKHVERLRELGFVDVHEQELKWPLGEWPQSKHERQIGSLTLENFSSFLATAGINLISQNSIVSTQQANQLVADAQKDLQENCLTKRFYLNM